MLRPGAAASIGTGLAFKTQRRSGVIIAAFAFEGLAVALWTLGVRFSKFSHLFAIVGDRGVICLGNNDFSGGWGVTPNLPQGFFLRLAMREFVIVRATPAGTAKLFESQILK